MPDLAVLVAAFVLILIGAELFTNAIEWFGHTLGLGEGAVGSVLAAIGTALPETTIPVIAIVFSGGAKDQVGLGAILGAPFMLATLAAGVTGIVVLLSRRRASGRELAVDRSIVRSDLGAFGLAYVLAVGAAFLPVDPTWPKLAVAVVLVFLYGRYVRAHFMAESSLAREGLNPLRLHRLDRRGPPAHEGHPPRLRIVNVQVVVGVAAIVIGAVAFVNAVSDVARGAGLSEVLLALIVAPIATELPEAANAVVWIRQGKDTLAIGNITGAMVFQASIATLTALVFAPQAWTYGPGTELAFASAAIALASAAAVFGPFLAGRRLRATSLLLGSGFYVAYLAVVAAVTNGA